MPRRIALPTASFAAVLVVGLLAGCAGSPGTDQTASPSPTASAAPDGTTSAEPTPSEAPKPTGTPITIDCDQLLTLDDMYAFNPNYGVANDYTPSGGEIATIVDENGLACAWSNQTSGELIEVAVAQPDPSMLEVYRADAAAGSTAVPTYGTPPAVDGFFASASGTGTAQVFSNGYWLVARSPAFFEPGDAAEIISAALSHLP